MKWISVKERLPEEYSDVWTLESYGQNFCWQIKQRHFSTYGYRTKGKVRKRKFPFGAQTREVHYWLPIPGYDHLKSLPEIEKRRK